MTVTHKGKTWKVFDRLTVRVEVEQLPAHRSRLLITIVPDDTPRGEIASA
jgi:exosome complex exonuclease DIS3/RRP44